MGETLLPKDSLPLLLTYIVDPIIIAHGWFLFPIHPQYDNNPVFVKVSSTRTDSSWLDRYNYDQLPYDHNC